MKEKGLLLICALLLFGNLSAQIELKGRVLDATTDEPIYNAHVYLAGTTIGTVTDTTGFYEIKLKQRINTQLVVSHILYEKVVVDEPYHSLPKELWLSDKTNSLDEVAVSYQDKFSREEKMEAFKLEFLGASKGAFACKIKNEDALHLVYNEENKTLIAISDVPLEIENPYLGYTILWDNVEFSIRYTDGTLSPKKIDLLTMIGYASFRERQTNNKIEVRRKEVYQVSKRCFFKNLAEGKAIWPQYRFMESQQKRIPLSWDHWFAVQDDPDTPSVKLVTIHPQLKDQDGKRSLLIDASLRKVVFRGKTAHVYSTSELVFLTDTFKVDAYGNTDLVKNLYQYGDMGRQRLGDMVPLDYMVLQ